MERKYSYEYPHPSVTVDLVVFTIKQNALNVLLIRRRWDPFGRMMAFPGGFVEINEGLDCAAARELREEAGLSNVFFEQLYTFGEPSRDPRERVITVAYYALISPMQSTKIQYGSDAADAKWVPVSEACKTRLAFDHNAILDMALQRIRGKIGYTNIGFELLEKVFTLAELQEVYEKILGENLDAPNFRKRMLAGSLLRPIKKFKAGQGRPARLFVFAKGNGND